jgi:hypothetical protein
VARRVRKLGRWLRLAFARGSSRRSRVVARRKPALDRFRCYVVRDGLIGRAGHQRDIGAQRGCMSFHARARIPEIGEGRKFACRCGRAEGPWISWRLQRQALSWGNLRPVCRRIEFTHPSGSGGSSLLPLDLSLQVRTRLQNDRRVSPSVVAGTDLDLAGASRGERKGW